MFIFNPLYLLFIILFVSTSTVISDRGVDNTCESISEIKQQIQVLDGKLEEIRTVLQTQANELKRQEHWEGNQSTIGSFKRLTIEEKRKLISFKLTDTENLDVTTLIQELRPCTNLESIKLNRVELIGTFPNTSTGRVTLPKLHKFELLLDNYVRDILSEIIFFQKSPDSQSVTPESVSDLMTDITVEFKGSKIISIDHDFGEMVLASAYNVPVLKGINPNLFSLKRLTVSDGSLNATEVPEDITYLNLKYVSMGSKYRPTTEYMDLLRKTRRLRALHIDSSYDYDFGAVIDLFDLPFDLETISFRNMRVNTTEKAVRPSLESLLLDNCHMDNAFIGTIKDSFYNLKRIAIFFDTDALSGVQCHKLIRDLVKTSRYFSSSPNLRRLKTISITACPRKFREGFNPEGYDEIEEFLVNLGLGKSTQFQLEKVLVNENMDDWVWKGKNLTENEKMRIKYDFADWKNLRTWKRYMGDRL